MIPLDPAYFVTLRTELRVTVKISASSNWMDRLIRRVNSNDTIFYGSMMLFLDCNDLVGRSGMNIE